MIEDTHSCYLGDRRIAMIGAMAAATCPACQLRAEGFAEVQEPKDHDEQRDDEAWIEGVVFLVLFCLTIPAANWMIGHVGTVCVPNGPCLIPVRAGLDGAVRRADGRHRAGAARSGAAAARRRLFGVGAIIVGAALSGLVLRRSSLVLASAAAFLMSEFADFAVYTPLARAAAGRGGGRCPAWSASWSIPSSSCGSPSARSTSCRPDRRQGLDGAAVDSVRCCICAAATSGSVSSPA